MYVHYPQSCHHTDAELVAQLLSAIQAVPNALAAATRLLDAFQGLTGLVGVPAPTLCQVAGLTKAQASGLVTAIEAGRRSARKPAPNKTMVRSSFQAYQHFLPAFQDQTEEQLQVLFLDNRLRLLAHRTLTHGSDRATVVDPRHIFQWALRTRASALIMAHNHPSGDPAPSTKDLAITKRVADIGFLLNIALLDHIILGENAFVSLAAKGAVPNIDTPFPLQLSEPFKPFQHG